MPQRSRLVVGVDVPWVTSWSEEALAGARPCAAVGGELAVFQRDKAGFGRPNYSENHFVRQRESVAYMLCPMCGAGTPEDDRWTLTAQPTTAGALRRRKLGHLLPRDLPDAQPLLNAGSISPLHRACAERSAAQCPHLGADPAVALRCFPDRWFSVPLWVEAHPLAPEQALLARESAPSAVVGFLQLIGLIDALLRPPRKPLRAAVRA